jgi:hypothetical protein
MIKKLFISVFFFLPLFSHSIDSNFVKIWEYELEYRDKANTVQSQPKYFDDLYFFVDGIGHLIALKKSSGSLIYRKYLGDGAGRRGFDIDAKSGRITIAAGPIIFIIDAKSGEILNKSNTIRSVAQPIVTTNCVIVFGADNGIVQCHSRSLEKLLWKVDLGETARVWSNPLWSNKHNQLYLTTSNAGSLVVENRKPDTYSSSLVGINASDGSIEFSRQMIKDDVWDFDGVGKPILVEDFVSNSGAKYDLIIATNKSGTIFAVNAKDGSEIQINQFEKQIFAKESGINSSVSEYQIIPSWPARTNDISITLNDLRPNQEKFELLRHARFEQFLPPSLDYDVVVRGLHGGPEWHGGEHYRYNNEDLLAFPINNTSWILRLKYVEDFWITRFISDNYIRFKNFINKSTDIIISLIFNESKTNINSVGDGQILNPWVQTAWSDSSSYSKIRDFIYKYTNLNAYNDKYYQKCAICHRNDRNGRFQSELTGDGYVPSLMGYTLTEKYKYGKDYQNFLLLHGLKTEVTKQDLDSIYEFFDEYDKKLFKEKKLIVDGFWQPLLGKDSLPLNKAPWGGVSIINLNTGKKIYEITVGKMRASDGSWLESSVIFGGLGDINSKGETLVVGTVDSTAYYISLPQGKVLETFSLKRPGSAKPLLTKINGCEAWVIIETGGRFSFYDKDLNGFTVETFLNTSRCGI